MKTDTGDLKDAKRAAYNLIKYRERSEKEIADRLKKKGFSDDVCGSVIAELKRLGYLDDTRFANIIAEEIFRERPAGIKFIHSKLCSKGVPKDVTDSVISGIKEGYDEQEAACRLAALRAKRLANIDPIKAKQRIYGFLARRRFSREVITEALSRIFKDDE